jgi:predicted nucleic acid-binding protein
VNEILVDANVLISFVTDRDLKQQEQADNLFKAAADQRHRLILHTISISEMVYVLINIYAFPRWSAAAALGKLLSMPGVVPEGVVFWNEVLALWPESISNLGDAVVASVAAQGSYEAVATFDRPLRKKLAKLGARSYWTDTH